MVFTFSLLDYYNSLSTVPVAVRNQSTVSSKCYSLALYRKCVHITLLHWLLIYLRIDLKKIF